MIAKEQANRHATLISNMKAAISNADQVLSTTTTQPNQPLRQSPFSPPQSPQTPPQYINGFINQTINPNINQGLQNLANNQVFTIDTISKQANRITKTPPSNTPNGFTGIFTPPNQ